ncbi:hypothetical protein [Hyalangium gracile]|uniref:hypothetical protein n=1 Tax=Hyalangium gracile TaxID=394092 RepID=UPI001CCB7871|nr:hypothetical protein [Hyalangium gracile]
MTGMLLISLASLGFVSTESPELHTAPITCTASAPGVTFGIGSGLMCFHYNTTCDGPVESITINASYSGPATGSGTKTCTDTSSCAYVLCTPYRRGTWSFTNDSTYTGGVCAATNSVTYNQ